MLVQDLMNTSPLCVSKQTPFADALAQLVEQKRSCLVIVEQQSPIGIVTERDLTQAFSSVLQDGSDQISAEALSISQIMTPHPVCIPGSMPFQEALALSRSRNLRHLPVVDEEGSITGIITQTNLLNAFSSFVNEQEVLETKLEQLKVLSLEDPLMKVGNRRAMEVDLNYTEAESKRHGKSFAVALFDIDFFKRYNDHYGHQAGDDALREVATAIKKAIRDSDRCFRYGGEEILVLMPHTNPECAGICAERVRKAIEDLGLPHVEAPLKVLTVSGGYCTQKQGSWQDMVALADEALYTAKSAGRNQVASA